MRIETLMINGWMPFGNLVELELPNGPIAVVGTHAGNARRSNRAGKTSLLEAITWCLFGVHRKRLDDLVIHRGSGEVVVEVGLGHLQVRRSRKRGSSTKLVVTERGVETTGKTAQEAIERFIGMGLEDYLATSCFRQGDVEAIINRTSSERLSLVSDWLQQSRWFDAKKIQAAKVNSADQRLAAKKAAAGSVESDVMTDALKSAMQAEVGRLVVTCEELQREIVAAHDRVGELGRVRQRAISRVSLDRIRAEAREVRASLAGRSNATLEHERLTQQVAEAKQAFAVATNELRALTSVRRVGFDGTCPVTCEACPVSDRVTQAAKSADALLSTRQNAERETAIALRQAEAELRSAANEVSGFERSAARYQALVQRGQELAASLEQDDGLVEEKEGELDALRDRLTQLQQNHANASKRIGELETTLESAEHSAERHERMLADVVELEKESRIKRLALRAIASIPARIAEMQLGELEREANQLLTGAGVSLRFSWQRELADKTPVCDECGYIYRDKRADECPACGAARGRKVAQELELLCDDGSGAEEDVRYNSGGTRAIVGAAVRLSASAMLRRLRSSQAAWAIVDEPFGPLDADNREMLARTFAGMLGSVGLEQALVVSHDPALLAALPYRVLVDKKGSLSTARVE